MAESYDEKCFIVWNRILAIERSNMARMMLETQPNNLGPLDVVYRRYNVIDLPEETTGADVSCELCVSAQSS